MLTPKGALAPLRFGTFFAFQQLWNFNLYDKIEVLISKIFSM